MTSVEEMAGKSYGRGHIVTVIGIDGSAMASPVEALFFNSALKGPGTSKVMCSADDLPGDQRYSAGLLRTSDCQLKPFGGKFLLMWIE
jgi:hypothetical protein